MKLYTLFIIIAACIVGALVAGCGSSSSDHAPVYEAKETTTYKLEYIPVTSAKEGKTSYKIRLTSKSTGNTVPGKTIALAAKMTMATMTHSTPMTALTDNGDGTYSGTAYYVMASVDASGASMGTWELTFTVDGESATFNPLVAMSMGSVAKLKGVTDTIGSMMGMGTTSRTYQVFNDGISGTTAKLFITAVDDAMMMTFPAVSVGTTLHNAMSMAVPVTAMSVEVSTDKSTWIALADSGNGYWTKSGLASMAAGSTLYVRLTVNGEQKTTDGKVVAADGSNGYQTLTVAGM